MGKRGVSRAWQHALGKGELFPSKSVGENLNFGATVTVHAFSTTVIFSGERYTAARKTNKSESKWKKTALLDRRPVLTHARHHATTHSLPYIFLWHSSYTTCSNVAGCSVSVSQWSVGSDSSSKTLARPCATLSREAFLCCSVTMIFL